MPTDIDIDDDLLARAMKINEGKTKKAVVEEGLRMLLKLNAQTGIRKLLGKAEFMKTFLKRFDCTAPGNRLYGDCRYFRVDRLSRGYKQPSDGLDQSGKRHDNDRFTELVLCESLQGTRGKPKFMSVRLELSAFDPFVSGSERLAIASARNYRLLRSRGNTVRNTIDCLIATFCIAEGHILLHNDRDFDPLEEHLGCRSFTRPVTKKAASPKIGSAATCPPSC